MKLSTFSYETGNGWSKSEFPALDSEQTLIIIFAAPEFIDKPGIISELAAAYPSSKMIGCSSAGEIAGPLVNDASLSVAVLKFERSRIAVVSTEIAEPADSFAVGEKLAAQLAHEDLCSVFVLSDGLRVNGSDLVKGFSSTLSPHVVVTGGLAADGDRFQRTWVIRDGKPETGIVTAAGFYGDSLQITHGSRGGWDSFGPERRVTRSQGNILYELDGRSALSLYKEYLGDLAAGLPANGLLFPLSIRQDAADSRELIRTVLAVDEATQSMTFAGDVPKGYLAQLMRANFDRLLDGASMAAEQARDNMAIAGPMLAVAISCVGRRLVLGERIEEETELTLQHLPEGAQQVGFYSYGEISPCVSGMCDLHNQTMTITTFSEA
ncbi:MAG: hypothetical protein A3I66_13240 [Burkholderiales bacterium RIFCSPLOWO2_02_FULL_57_36]|nr:MAG: hypothetical protein A3I66_13240 [Burkholderiales bacterium RIFCSPLOWO2_02_FULL_57_36]